MIKWMLAAVLALLLLTEAALHLSGRTEFRITAFSAYLLATLNFIVALVAVKKAFRRDFTGFVVVFMGTGVARMVFLLVAVFLVARYRPGVAMLFSVALVGLFLLYLVIEIVIFMTQIRNKK